MLDGKGLKDWQWVYRAFPKWMIKEMDVFEDQERPKWEGNEGKVKEGKQRMTAKVTNCARAVTNMQNQRLTQRAKLIRCRHHPRIKVI